MEFGAVLSSLAALFQVVFIDVALAGDNAVVVGLAVAGLPSRQRRLALTIGVGAAMAIRIGLGLIALRLLAVLGLTLAGGLLLLWVAWRLWRELRTLPRARAKPPPRKRMSTAMAQIVAADVSMSLDNVLAIAGAARNEPVVMAIGLTLSVALMGVGAELIARFMEQKRWIGWAGLAIVLYVALRMIAEGTYELWRGFFL
jgi:YjbE family integral membrane protein